MPVIEMISTMQSPPALKKLKPHVSLGDIERGTGINHPQLSRIFNGKRNMKMTTANRIANFLQVSVDDLLSAIEEAKLQPDSRFNRRRTA